ncbi:MAG: hypothetical protein R3C03_21925 [Pirellulaceae bacterium]
MKDADPTVKELFQGIKRHLDDDRWFHGTEAFAELNLIFSSNIRRCMPELSGIQSHFLGHILIEVLLDDELHRRFPGELSRYYSQLDEVDGDWLEAIIRRYSDRPDAPVKHFFDRFRETRFLFDYGDNATLLFRLNQVMKRARLQALDDRLFDWLPIARTTIAQNAQRLLPNYPMSID